jgi:hypothetical protein
MADKNKGGKKPVRKKATGETAPKTEKAKAGTTKTAPKVERELVGYRVKLVDGVKSLDVKGASRWYKFVHGKAITVTDPQDQVAFLTEARLSCTAIYRPKRQKA